MSGKRPKKYFASRAAIVTETYRGPDRRDPEAIDAVDYISREIKFDAKGNPVLDVRVNVPRRRDGDATIDLLKCLDAASLGLEIDD